MTKPVCCASSAICATHSVNRCKSNVGRLTALKRSLKGPDHDQPYKPDEKHCDFENTNMSNVVDDTKFIME